MALLCVGLLLNTTSMVLTRSLHASGHFSANSIDFVRGFCVGLGITLEIAAIMAMLPAVRAKRRRSDPPIPPRA